MLTDAFKKTLMDRFNERVEFDVPMAGHTSLRVGGPADALATPADTYELTGLLAMLIKTGVPWFVLGGGTNLLVRDSGIRGVVISLRPGFSDIAAVDSDQDAVAVHAGAGARLSALCRYALANNLAGMNFALGIPGSVGGAVIMNAGTENGAIESVLSSIEVLHVPDQKEIICRRALLFNYRGLVWDSSIIAKSGYEPIVLAASFELAPADPRTQAAEAETLRARRKQRQPAGFSAGCVFKNPSADAPAGYLIDQAGLKGTRIGDAQVSEVHANFIVNLGRAGATDILRLMDIVREKVLHEYGVELEPEIRTVGESKEK
ncbi:MAG: UDP-N-acetylmuramate dehydrogenase [Desulfobacteraceae bacterium]|nr:UDP-N-acetylmuramate dehydrogenase [Desulfobacteraceae bacterium]MCF8094791.1 UDP-N-acetylmuramate dehydrogenase [Desulfobacteraceae bacterium]